VGLHAWAEVIVGNYAKAAELAPQSQRLCKRLNQPWIDAFCSMGLAFVPVYRTQVPEALTAMRELAARFDGTPDDHMHMFMTMQLALQEFLSGNLNAARRCALDGLDFTRRIGNIRGFTGVYEMAAYIATQEGKPEVAARFMGMAETGRIMSGAPQAKYWLAPHAAAWTQICTRLGPSAAQALHAEGRRGVPADGAALAMEFLRT
jgi:hypothetical protein